LKDVTLRSLDVGLLQAGASMKGEFENRLRQVIDEVQSSPKPIILFIDEAHTLVGAGGAAGTGDAANLLKPALARGKLRTIAATTWAEYKKHIEKDPALTRRFQVVQVPEPTEEKALLMMRGVASTLEAHHRVQVLDEALEASVKLSHRYIPARQLPDKSVSLLDTACARVAISQHAVPAEVEDCRSRITALETETQIIGREQAAGWDTKDREDNVKAKLEIERKRLGELETPLEVGEGAGRSDPGDPEDVARRHRAGRGHSQQAGGAGRDVAVQRGFEDRRKGDNGRRGARQGSGPQRSRAGRPADQAAWPAGVAVGAARAHPPHPAHRRRAGGGIGRGRLDRDSRRPHGQERDRDRAETGRDAGPARDRAEPWPGDDHPAASRRRAPGWRIPTSRSVSSCWRDRRASARPRRRWRWPSPCMAVSRI
jgi:hypothetical protein